MVRVCLLTLMLAMMACQTSSSPPFFGYAIEGFPLEKNAVQQLAESTPIRPEIIEFYVQWPKESESSISPQSTLEAIWQAGALPCLTWEPMYYVDQEKVFISATTILQGGYEAYLSAMAEAFKAYDKPFLLRFAHEMNFEGYQWGKPEVYKELFRYLVTYFRKAGVKNILWVFCPNADSVPNEAWNQASRYYPGDTYIDILGMDGYNWAQKSFEQVFNPIYRELKTLSPDKPLFVFETGTEGSAQEKEKWLQEAIKTAAQWRIQGLIWFQVNKERQWKLPPHLTLPPTSPSAQPWAQKLQA